MNVFGKIYVSSGPNLLSSIDQIKYNGTKIQNKATLRKKLG